MNNPNFDIQEITKEDSPLVASFIAEQWGSPMTVSKGRLFNTADLPGFILKKNNKILGLITFHIEGKDCEIVTLNSKINRRGLAIQLIYKVIEKAKSSGCKRLWLITTNDNTTALCFYQKRGFEWVGFYRNSMEKSRELKPEIPEYGNDGIPIRHEIEFEFRL